MREAHSLCDEHGDVATASLLEVWIDEAEQRVWFLFEASRRGESGGWRGPPLTPQSRSAAGFRATHPLAKGKLNGQGCRCPVRWTDRGLSGGLRAGWSVEDPLLPGRPRPADAKGHRLSAGYASLTAERIAKAPKLKLAITAGIGSDQVGLQAAIDRGIAVAEITCCNSISVAEHAVMAILAFVRDYQCVLKGGWNIADCVARSYAVGGCTSARSAPAGSAWRAAEAATVRRASALLWSPSAAGIDRGRAGFHLASEVEDLVGVCDVVSVHVPLHPQTEDLFDDKLIARMKRGAYLVNTGHGKICNRDAVVRALKSG
jgi:D-isomer specific 2-hydroxyacid dehydrogenase, NAD binding domain/D-isomer specific 2-hydroxyacid dehydrogenase, catalytic domain